MTSTVVNKEYLLAVILRIKTLCEGSQNGETMMRFVLKRMLLLVPVLQVTWDRPSGSPLLNRVYADLKALKNTIKKLAALNRIVYLVQAVKLHEDLVHGEIQAITTTLSQDPSITALVKQYQRQCLEQEKEFELFQKAVQQEQLGWIQGETDLIQAFAGVLGDTITRQEIRHARQILQIDLGELILQKSSKTDPLERSKVIETELYWEKILEHLRLASLCSGQTGVEEPLFPDWALDPVTHSVLIHPVIVRAECNHVVSMSTFEAHLQHGHTTCPVCQTTLQALYGTPHKKLQRKIHKLSLGEADGRHGMDDSSHHPLPGSTTTTPRSSDGSRRSLRNQLDGIEWPSEHSKPVIHSEGSRKSKPAEPDDLDSGSEHSEPMFTVTEDPSPTGPTVPSWTSAPTFPDSAPPPKGRRHTMSMEASSSMEMPQRPRYGLASMHKTPTPPTVVEPPPNDGPTSEMRRVRSVDGMQLPPQLKIRSEISGRPRNRVNLLGGSLHSGAALSAARGATRDGESLHTSSVHSAIKTRVSLAAAPRGQDVKRQDTALKRVSHRFRHMTGLGDERQRALSHSPTQKDGKIAVAAKDLQNVKAESNAKDFDPLSHLAPVFF